MATKIPAVLCQQVDLLPPGQVADFATTKEALGSALEPERPPAPLILFSEIPLTFSSFGVQLNRFPSKFPGFVPDSGV